METYGESARGFSWSGLIDSRDLHRFEKQCCTTKGGSCSVSHPKQFSRCPPAQCSTCPAPFVDALAFVLSTSAREHPSSSLIRSCGDVGVASSLFPQFRTVRTKVATLRAILLQPVPSKLFTTVVLFVSHSKKFLHHRRLMRVQTTCLQAPKIDCTLSCVTLLILNTKLHENF